MQSVKDVHSVVSLVQPKGRGKDSLYVASTREMLRQTLDREMSLELCPQGVHVVVLQQKYWLWKSLDDSSTRNQGVFDYGNDPTLYKVPICFPGRFLNIVAVNDLQ